jgi:hypothetical protein
MSEHPSRPSFASSRGTPCRRRVRTLVILVALLSVGSCVDGAFPIPRDSVDVEVDLPPGATETYEFDIEAEAFTGGDESVILRMSPEADSLRADGVAVEQSWTHKGVTETGWPVAIDVEHDEPMIAILILRLTNEGPIRIEKKLTIAILASGDIPSPSEEELRVEIDRR